MAIGQNFRSAQVTQGQPLGMYSQTVTLTADNQVVNPSSPLVAMINLESDNTTAASRTFTLINGQTDGQELLLIFTAGSSFTAQLADSGNCVLSAAWEPLVNDALRLVWNARLAKWVEVARVDN